MLHLVAAAASVVVAVVAVVVVDVAAVTPAGPVRLAVPRGAAAAVAVFLRGLLAQEVALSQVDVAVDAHMGRPAAIAKADHLPYGSPQAAIWVTDPNAVADLEGLALPNVLVAARVLPLSPLQPLLQRRSALSRR